MKVYVVCIKEKNMDRYIQSVYGVYCSLNKANSIRDYLESMGEIPEMYIKELEGE
jgi:hypothetical protein